MAHSFRSHGYEWSIPEPPPEPHPATTAQTRFESPRRKWELDPSAYQTVYIDLPPVPEGWEPPVEWDAWDD